MSGYSSWTLAAALLMACAGYASGQTGTPPDPGAAANVRQSQQYEQALQSNPSFRAKRIQQECGPVTDPQLHANCLASFGAGAASSSGKRR
jgi:hypothetical protein